MSESNGALSKTWKWPPNNAKLSVTIIIHVSLLFISSLMMSGSKLRPDSTLSGLPVEPNVLVCQCISLCSATKISLCAVKCDFLEN
jgi:hypothetical protein